MGGAVEIKLALILAILSLIVLVGFKLVRFGKDRAVRKQLEREAKARVRFDKEGEDWDAAGGLDAAIERGLSDDE